MKTKEDLFLELTSKQNETGQELERIISNYKKDSVSRKTNEYLTNRLGRLSEIWKTFDKTNEQLKEFSCEFPEHHYFRKQYFQAVEIEYLKARDSIVTLMHSLPSASSNKGDEEAKKRETANFNEPSLRDSSIEVAGLIRQQRSRIRALEYIINGINSVEQPQLRQYYEMKIATVGRYWDELRNGHQNIEQYAPNSASVDYTDKEYFTIEERIQDILVFLETGLEKCNSSTLQTSSVQPHLKLPQVTIPKFDGDYAKWKSFHDLFTQMIHEQPLGNAQKMWYLRVNLAGEAERLIRHLPISDENYIAAWSILNNRYDNKRLMVSTLLDKLMCQPAISVESSGALKGMHDVTAECLLGLKSLQVDIATWDPMMLHVLTKKLDKATHNLYEQSLTSPRDLQTIDYFLSFIERRFQALEALGTDKRTPNKPSATRTAALMSVKDTLPAIKCKNCGGNHKINACVLFKQLQIPERINRARQLKLCLNCLGEGHFASQCTSRACLKCQKGHNTLLHLEKQEKCSLESTTKSAREAQPIRSNQLASVSVTKPDVRVNESVSLSTEGYSSEGYAVLLSTAIVRVINKNGEPQELRALLDSGSQINIITEAAIQKLGLQTTQTRLSIRGLGGACQQARRQVGLTIQSKITNFATKVNAIVLPQITSVQPTSPLDIATREAIPKNIRLADPTFDQPGDIDLLLGAEIYYELLAIGQIRIAKRLPMLQNTVFGWIVAGRFETTITTLVTCGVSEIEERTLNEQIERFWKLEEAGSENRHMTGSELKCESEFAKTTKRTNEGRFVVKLPFAKDPDMLGESMEIATRRLLQIERRLAKDKSLYQQYRQFMNEYKELGHMKEVNINMISEPRYFLPHHCVLRPESTTTKLRVVFDASAKTSSGVSLNQLLCTGPTVQDDLFTILLRFRLPRYVFTADIEKMYRQINMSEPDRKFQLILWRDSPLESIKCYELNTVTYGTTSAPYLATKCLQELANETSSQYPSGAAALKHDFYVDDVMSGADTLANAIEKQQQLQQILKSAHFKLRKWCANHSSLLQNIPVEDQALAWSAAEEIEGHIKTLGLIWAPKKDEFRIKALSTQSNRVTKRAALADISQLFDPLGLVSPVTVVAKIFLQKLWRLKVDWDAALPMDLHSEWLTYRKELEKLNEISIPRHVARGKIPQSAQLHIFADASEKAYGAVAYFRAFHADGIRTVNVLCSKSRVAPLKRITLPRLELCAAKLASELGHRLKRELRIADHACYFWTDSKIVLHWIHADASLFHTFVANRVSAIQQLSIPFQWRHVRSEHNPADLVSRGVMPEKLKNCNLWFFGPMFLHGLQEDWPAFRADTTIEHEKKQNKTVLSISKDTTRFIDQIDHQNSIKKLQRIVAYMLRFINNVRSPSKRHLLPQLLAKELEGALQVIIKEAQWDAYSQSVRLLQANKQLDNNDPLSRLNPFLDEFGLLRVKGRLEESSLPYDAKHPIILPYAHNTTKLILQDIHIQHLHAGPQALLVMARQRYWPVKGKTLARSVVHNCVRCSKARPRLMSQLMGNLPATRIQPARPFINTGVDFAGPFWTHFKVRGKRPQKTYLAVFVCFTTKAVHLELVTDLTTEAFIGALKRFIGRRGHCRSLYCDNATNFVGAKNQLAELKDVIYEKGAQQKINNLCSPKGIDFHFIPPRSPHFGGLWEAAVKSAKHLLIKNITPSSLTYEELETVIIQIEAILNSRPLTPLSADSTDLNALTPGHFLIGEPLTSSVDVQAQENRSSLACRWRQINDIRQKFWQRWSTEYLTELQQRSKWKQRCENIKPGMLVVIKEDNLPVLKWQMGRIVKGIKGADGLIRVADVRTAAGILRRPIHKLAPLPVEVEEVEEVDTLPESNSTMHIGKDKPTDNLSAGPSIRKPSLAQTGEPKAKCRRLTASPINLLLWTSLILPVLSNPVKITPFESPQGIYFESLGAVNLVLSEWNLVVHYNLTPYWEELQSIRRGWATLHNICRQIQHNWPCARTTMQLDQLMHQIDVNSELLRPPPKTNPHRKQRGALNVVGNIANTLFGVLDSDYATRMEGVIDNLKHNDEHLVQLLKNQTSIIDSTTNIMMHMEKSTGHALEEFHLALNKTVTRTNQIARELWDNEAVQAFSSATVQLFLGTHSIQRIQSFLLDVLVDTHHGKVNPQLLSNQQILQELRAIKENLPPHLHLPVKPENLLDLYSLLTIEGRIMNSKIIFRIKLPLFSDERFELLHLVPVPTIVNHTVLMIQTASNYLITTWNREQYYSLSNQELAACSRTATLNYICKQLHPLYQTRSGVNECELSFISHVLPKGGCQTIQLKQPPRWIQLLTPNHWIYFMESRTDLSIACGDFVTQETIEGSGIIQLRDDCILKEDRVTIHAHKLFSSYFNASFVPTRNITEDIIRNITHVSSQEFLMKNLTELKANIHNLLLQEDLHTNLDPTDIHHFTLGYTGLACIIIIAAYLVWKRKQGAFNATMRKPTPAPRPRSQPTPSFTISVDPEE